MNFIDAYTGKLMLPDQKKSYKSLLHLDWPLVICILLLLLLGAVILYSASNENMQMVKRQFLHTSFALLIMFGFAQIPPASYQRWAPLIYGIGLLLLIIVSVMGHINKGGQRWLHLGFFRFQPSEIMKLAIPMLLAWQFHRIHLPVTAKSVLLASLFILFPAFITAKQPDLSTAIILIIAGGSVLFFAGFSIRLLMTVITMVGVSTPIIWHFLYDYQKLRILTFFNPERDPLGSGYHIIQSKIALGSGGFFGKGWLNGTQSHLHFLPEHTTDFIFAVCGEEFGFIGCCILIVIFMAMVIRSFYITIHAQDTFTRLLAGSISLTLFASFFINVGMVTGILPVMGIPLPLISYGGSSIVTLMASLGILMSIQTHRKLVTT